MATDQRTPRVLISEPTNTIVAPRTVNLNRIGVYGRFRRGPANTHTTLSSRDTFSRRYGIDTNPGSLCVQTAFDQGAGDFAIYRIVPGASAATATITLTGIVGTAGTQDVALWHYKSGDTSGTGVVVAYAVTSIGETAATIMNRLVSNINANPVTVGRLNAVYNSTATPSITLTTTTIGAAANTEQYYIAVGSSGLSGATPTFASGGYTFSGGANAATAGSITLYDATGLLPLVTITDVSVGYSNLVLTVTAGIGSSKWNLTVQDQSASNNTVSTVDAFGNPIVSNVTQSGRQEVYTGLDFLNLDILGFMQQFDKSEYIKAQYVGRGGPNAAGPNGISDINLRPTRAGKQYAVSLTRGYRPNTQDDTGYTFVKSLISVSQTVRNAFNPTTTTTTTFTQGIDYKLTGNTVDWLYDSLDLAQPGTVTVTSANYYQVIGTNTTFLTTFSVGNLIKFNSVSYTIASITNDLLLTLTTPAAATSGASYVRDDNSTVNEPINATSMIMPAVGSTVAAANSGAGTGSLTNATTYYYVVCAGDAGGYTTLGTVVNVAATSTGTINLTWTAVSNATKYRVFRKTTTISAGDTSVSYYDILSGTTLNYLDTNAAPTGTATVPSSNTTTGVLAAVTGLNAATTYFYTVCASPDNVNFTTISGNVPSAVVSSTGIVNVTWPISAGANYYRVFRKPTTIISAGDTTIGYYTITGGNITTLADTLGSLNATTATVPSTNGTGLATVLSTTPTTVTGTGTAFINQFAVGDTVTIRTRAYSGAATPLVLTATTDGTTTTVTAQQPYAFINASNVPVIQLGDIIRIGSENRKITAITSATVVVVDYAFAANTTQPLYIVQDRVITAIGSNTSLTVSSAFTYFGANLAYEILRREFYTANIVSCKDTTVVTTPLYGGSDGPLPSAQDYINAINTSNTYNLNYIVVGAEAGIVDNFNVHAAQITAVDNSVELTGLRIAILQAPKSWTTTDTIVSNSLTYAQPSVYKGGAVMVYSWHTYTAQTSVAPLSVPGNGFYVGHLASTPFYVSPAARRSSPTIKNIVDTTLTTSQDYYNAIADAGFEALILDPAIGQYHCLTGKTTSTDSNWVYISVRRVYNVLRENIYFALSWVKSEPASTQNSYYNRINDSVDNILQNAKNQGIIEAFVPTTSTASSSDRAAGIVKVYTSITPVYPADFINLEINRSIPLAINI